MRADFIDYRIVLAYLTMVFCVSAGCGGGSQKLPSVEITGTVTLEGDGSLTEGSILFTSRKSGVSAFGIIGDNGQYSLSLPHADIGAKYDVTVGPLLDAQEILDPLAAKPAPRRKTKVPRRYSSRTSSGLNVIIEHTGKNEFDFDLNIR